VDTQSKAVLSEDAGVGSFAALVFVRPPAGPREVRLNGFPGALAEVTRNRFGGGRCGGPRDSISTGLG